MPHSPARWLPYGRPETSQLLKLDHYMLHARIKMRMGGCAASSPNTDVGTGAGGRQVLRPPVHDERYALPDIGVCTRRFEGRNTRLGPSGRRGLTPRLQQRSRRLWRAIVELSRSGAVRSVVSWRNVHQNTARNARIIDNMVICRTFMRSVLTSIITRPDGYIARISQIATAGPTSEIGGFCGSSRASTWPRSVRAVCSPHDW
jgi:hypothetical protein